MRSGDWIGDSLALRVHGPAGVLDLAVPPEAGAVDVAREYAAQCYLGAVPALHTTAGRRLDAGRSLAESGVGSGDLLIATGAAPLSTSPRREVAAGPVASAAPGGLCVLWFCVCVGTALLAAWFATTTNGPRHDVVVALLVFSAVLGVLPVGRLAPHRATAAPAFAGAAAFVVAWSPQPERLPTVIGVAALVAAVTAAVGRSLDTRPEEGMRVWIAAGLTVFLVSSSVALLGLAAQVVWAILLLLAMLGARFVPGFAVDVPDQLLIDIERLAVSAWSARSRPTGRRDATIVRARAVAVVAAQGARLVTAASAAILVVAAVSAPLLLQSATDPVDRIGARVQVVLVGAALLLAARSYRHVVARALLRLAGLACAASGLSVLLGLLAQGRGTTLALAVSAVAMMLVLVAVATGRGWRSAWWSRRAEVAEGLVGAFAIASVFVSIGLFRALWEI